MLKAHATLTAIAAVICFAATTQAGAAEPTAHYDIDAKLNMREGTVSAKVAIRLPPAEAGTQAVFVLGGRFDLNKTDGGRGVKVSMEPTDVPLKGLQKITFAFERAPRKPVTLRFEYSGPLFAVGETGTLDPKEGVELGFENSWIPFRPNFNLVFTSDTRLDGIPEDWVVVGQGNITRKGTRVGLRRDVTDLDIPIAALSGLKHDASPGADFYARDLDGPLEKFYRQHSGPIVEFYRHLIGPQPSAVRMVVLPRKGAAYARRGYISMPDAREEIKQRPNFDPNVPVRTEAHEYAHGWWWSADPLTEDHWLNESMAEYSALRYVEHAFGVETRDKMLDGKRERAAKSGAVIGRGRPGKDALYQRGPLLLFELEAKIGRPAMDKLLLAFGRKLPRTTADFLEALTAVAGAKAAREFEVALRAP